MDFFSFSELLYFSIDNRPIRDKNFLSQLIISRLKNSFPFDIKRCSTNLLESNAFMKGKIEIQKILKEGF